MVESERVPGKGPVHASTEKLFGRVTKNGRISVSTAKWKNLGKYREKVDSVRAPKNGRICVSTAKWKNPGVYREKVESLGVSKNFPDEYRNMVESM